MNNKRKEKEVFRRCGSLIATVRAAEFRPSNNRYCAYLLCEVESFLLFIP
jgi:hypothetical protein